MKSAILALWFVPLAAFGDKLPLGFSPVAAPDARPSAATILKIEAKANRVVWQSKEKKFDLGLGKVADGARSPIHLSFDEIEEFLKQEKPKGLIVVWFDKATMWNEQDFVRTRADEVVKPMTDVGYKRVVILGAHGAGVHYVADTDLTHLKGS